MSDGARVQIDIEAERNTGDIDVTAGQLGNLAGAAADLLGPLAALGSVAGIAAFFREASAAAEENVQALAHLQAQLSAAGLDVASSTKTVQAWAEELQQTSRFGAPELEAALSRVVAKTGDLAESQKLVQLAMNISVATGKDFNGELDNLTLAAGGSARGVMALQRELGQQAVGITDVNELLNMLAARYKDNAEQSKTLTDATAQTKNTFHDMAAIVGDSLHPAMMGLQSVAQSLEKAFGTLWSLMSLGVKDTAAEVNAMLLSMISSAVEAGRILKDVATGNFSDITEARAQAAREQAVITDAANKAEKAAAEQSNRELQALGTQAAEDKKSAIKDVSDFSGIQNKTDLAQEIATAQAEVAAVKAGEAQKLAEKNLSSQERLQIVADALAKELSILDANHSAWVGKEAQFQAERQKLISEAALKSTQIEQKYQADRVAALESWAAKNTQVGAEVQASMLKVADGIASGLGQAFAKSIVEGKSFSDSIHNLEISLAEAIIAEGVRIVAADAIAQAVQVARHAAAETAKTGATTAGATTQIAANASVGAAATASATAQVAAAATVTAALQAQTAAVVALTAALAAATTQALALDAALAAAAL